MTPTRTPRANRTILREVIAEYAECDPATVDRVLAGLIQAVAAAAAAGVAVSIRGFGRFEVKQLRSTRRRIPKTGEVIVVPARKSVRFTPGGVFRRALQ